jgi:hypothetical protein
MYNQGIGLKEKMYSGKIEHFSYGNMRRIKETANSKNVKYRFHWICVPRKLWEKRAHTV